MSNDRNLTRTVLDAIRGVGGNIDDVDMRRTHPMVKWTYRGKKETFTCSTSSSDRNAGRNAEAYIRRRARAIDNELS